MCMYYSLHPTFHANIGTLNYIHFASWNLGFCTWFNLQWSQKHSHFLKAFTCALAVRSMKIEQIISKLVFYNCYMTSLDEMLHSSLILNEKLAACSWKNNSAKQFNKQNGFLQCSKMG